MKLFLILLYFFNFVFDYISKVINLLLFFNDNDLILLFDKFNKFLFGFKLLFKLIYLILMLFL